MVTLTHTAKMSNTTAFSIPNSLKVTSGPSTDTEINIDTPLVKYFARFNSNSNPLQAKFKSGELQIGEGDLRISFRRTVRVPPNSVDVKPSSLPQGLGRFPLYSVADFPNLPRQMIEKRGFFMPMYRMPSIIFLML